MYEPQARDTRESDEKVQFEILARMSPAEKARIVTDLTLAVQQLAFAGLRQQYPDAPDDEIWLRLAARRLGRETVRKVYGRDPGQE